MRKKLFTLLTILVTATSLIVGCQTLPKKTEPTIQEVKGTPTLRDPTTVLKGLEARSLDEVLRLPDDEIDLATAILLILKKAHKDLDKIDIDVHRYRDRVDEIASAYLSRVEKEKSPEAIIRVMNHYVFEELNFSAFGEAREPKPTFLTFVLDERKGNCFGLSTLFLSIAERIGLSLFGVTAPGHAFVRYDDNVKRINIETTAKGKTDSDNVYIDKFDIPRDSEFYLKSLRKKEMIGVFLNNVGIAYSNKGQYDQAISDYNKALEINPRHAAAYNNRGIAYSNKGQYDQGIADQNKALEINPRLAEAYTNRGIAYSSKGQYNQAIADYNKALEINPRLAEAYTNRGVAYSSKGQYDQAIADYNKALEINPWYAEAYNNRGNAYSRKDLHDQAISDYNKVLEINPWNARAYYNMALAFDKTGRTKEAIEAYGGFIQYAPAMYQRQIEHARKRINELER